MEAVLAPAIRVALEHHGLHVVEEDVLGRMHDSTVSIR